MSKWRPSELNCLYVIPDIHGAYYLLEVILKRILPLRKSDGGQDKIIFLGDYIDRGPDSYKVLDRLIELKNKYPEQIICLCGNHELMLLQSIGLIPHLSPQSVYDLWADNGGLATINNYIKMAGIDCQAYSFSQNRIKNIIPQTHIDFLMGLDGFYEEDGFVFVHGGCVPGEPPSKFNIETLVWDRSLFKFVKECIINNQQLPWTSPVIITGHNKQANNKPIIKPQYMMLDCGAPNQLLVVEARSRDARMAELFKSRLVKFVLSETVNDTPNHRKFIRRIS